MDAEKLYANMIGVEYPSQDMTETIDRVKHNLEESSRFLNVVLPEGRHKSLALTALEEASMWAVKSVTLDSQG